MSSLRSQISKCFLLLNEKPSDMPITILKGLGLTHIFPSSVHTPEKGPFCIKGVNFRGTKSLTVAGLMTGAKVAL